MKILLLDDHALFRDGMRYVLEQLPEAVEILEADNLQDGMKLAELNPDLDLALLDLNMPDSEGVVSIRNFHRSHPAIPVVVVSGEEDRDIISQVINGGAMGFVCKNTPAPVILKALTLVLSGGIYVPPQILQQQSVAGGNGGHHDRPVDAKLEEYRLTDRQMQVLKYLAAGLTNKEIAEAIHLAEGTVKVHVASLYQTLHVNGRLEAVRMAEKLGLIGSSHG